MPNRLRDFLVSIGRKLGGQVDDKITVKMTVSIGPESQEDLQWLRNTTSITEYGKLFRRALHVFRMIVKHELGGGQIVFRSHDGTETRLERQLCIKIDK